MKVFVATSEGQGLRQTDFYSCNEGELVIFPSECDFEIDGRCGCRRSMKGLESGVTTTFKVINSGLTEEEYFEKFNAYWVKTDKVYAEIIEQDHESFRAEVRILLQTANKIPVGVVLEKRGDDIQSRPQRSFADNSNKE